MPAVHFKVQGQVQGVGFRYYVWETARRLKLKGWVKNLPEGTVEGLVQGNANDIAVALNLIKKGPPGAFVTGIKEEEILENSTLAGFSIAP